MILERYKNINRGLIKLDKIKMTIQLQLDGLRAITPPPGKEKQLEARIQQCELIIKTINEIEEDFRYDIWK